MSDSERTEPATPRRLREARRRGEVPRSRDLTGALVLWLVLAAVVLGVVPQLGELASATGDLLRRAPSGEGGSWSAELSRWGVAAAGLAWPVLLAAVAAALASGMVQVGGLFSLEPVRPRLDRVSPGAGIRRLLGARSWFQAGKAVFVFGVVLGAAAWSAAGSLAPVVDAARAGTGPTAAALGRLLLRTTLAAGFALTLLGVVDLVWQRRRHARDLRMTREEVKREHREDEGDPQIRSERRRLHREMLAQRMVLDVSRATCVVVNPTHLAVALRYDADDPDAAPVVLAKGEGELAQRIVAAARAAGVPVLRNAPVARSLLACELGEAIPERLYEGVAEVLRIVLEDGRG